MADVYEQNLSAKSSLTTSDYIRVVGSDNVSYKQLVSDVANKIISSGYLEYGLGTIASSADLNTYRTAGVYTCPSGSVASTLSNCPTTSAFRLEVKQIVNADRYVQVIYVNYNIHPTLYWRTYNGAWSSWYAPALNGVVTAGTLSSSHTLVSGQCYLGKYGNIVYLTVGITTTSAVSAYGTLATIPSGFRPVSQFWGRTLQDRRIDVTASGALRAVDAIGSGEDTNFSCCYITT